MTKTAHNIDIHVGKRLKARRQALGLTQSDIGSAVNVAFQQVQKYETGVNRIAASRLYELSKVLDVTTSYFFEGLEEPELEAAA